MDPYVTLLSTPDYLPGVLGLARSLRATGTVRPLVVALTADIGAEAEAVLRREGLETLRLPPMHAPPGLEQSPAHHWTHTFDKLHLFGLTQYRKLVYLD